MKADETYLLLYHLNNLHLSFNLIISTGIL